MYADLGEQVHFIFIYTIEAHPVGSPSPYSGKEWPESASTDEEGNPRTQPTTYKQRVALATEMIQELGITIPILIDEIDNPMWCTYGPAPDIAYLIGTDGVIVDKQGWYEPSLMVKAINEYLNGGQ